MNEKEVLRHIKNYILEIPELDSVIAIDKEEGIIDVTILNDENGEPVSYIL